MRKASGGYSSAIKGKPTDKYCDVLSNCVGYANGRFAEIIGKNKIEYQLVCNAENFIERAKKLGLEVVDYPTLGGIMVMQKGKSLKESDGAGHCFIVERIDSPTQIYTSESAYGGKAFYNTLRSNKNGRWGMGSSYTFRGCIVNPAIGKVTYKKDEEVIYVVKSGDNLSKIAKKYNTSFQKIYQDNKKIIDNENKKRGVPTSKMWVYPGQKLVIK